MLEKTLSLFKTTGHPTRTVLHVGMGQASEIGPYRAAGFKNIILVEGDSQACSAVVPSEGVEVLNYFVSDKTETAEFFQASNQGLSSSILSPQEHLKRFPNVRFQTGKKVITNTLSNILTNSNVYNPNELDLLVIDIQGAELKALEGFLDIAYPAIIQLEVNYVPMYKGAVLFPRVLEFMVDKQFKFIHATRLGGYGDAIFINLRKDITKKIDLVDRATAPFVLSLWRGLSDRLLTVQAGKILAENFQLQPLSVDPAPSDAFPASIEDFFEPISGVNYTSSPGGQHLELRSNWWDRKILCKTLAASGLLKVKTVVEDEARSILKGAKNLLAVHIRRTDRLGNPVEKMRTIEEAISVMDKHVGDLFLATDCPSVQKSMRQRYGSRLIVYKDLTLTSNKRHTTPLHAVVDLTICIEAKNFNGDPISGWYMLIQAFREMGVSILKGGKIMDSFNFHHIGKTGGCSLYKAVTAAADPTLKKEDDQWASFNLKTLRHDGYFNYNVPTKLIFSVRDPIARMVSGYYCKWFESGGLNSCEVESKHMRLDFNDFVEAWRTGQGVYANMCRQLKKTSHHLNTMKRWYGDVSTFAKHPEKVKFILFLETLEEDYNRLRAEVENFKNFPDLTVINSTPVNLNRNISRCNYEFLYKFFEEDYEFVNICELFMQKAYGRVPVGYGKDLFKGFNVV